MKTKAHYEKKVFGMWINYGFSFRRFGLGITFDKYFLSIDILFFWCGIEF